MDVLDNLIIGTSPIAIVEAVYLKSKKKTVLNIDEKIEIGGAWGTISHKGFPEVESGCHIWSYNKEVYQLISELLDIDLVKLKPQPSILYKNKLIPYDWKSNVIALQKVVKNLKNIKKVIAEPDVRLSLFPSKYLYPLNGALDLKASLERIVENKALDIKLNTEVDKVVINKDRVQIFNKREELVAITNELILTSLSKISSVVLDNGNVLVPSTRKVDYVHAHLIIENVSSRLFSYIRINDDKIIHRISDMSSQVEGQLEANQVLFCVGIFSKPFYEKGERELKAYIQQFLLRNRFISEESSIINYTTNVYPSYYNDSSFIEELKSRTKGKIRFLRSTDFVYSFFNQKDRYKELLPSHSK